MSRENSTKKKSTRRTQRQHTKPTRNSFSNKLLFLSSQSNSQHNERNRGTKKRKRRWERWKHVRVVHSWVYLCGVKLYSFWLKKPKKKREFVQWPQSVWRTFREAFAKKADKKHQQICVAKVLVERNEKIFSSIFWENEMLTWWLLKVLRKEIETEWKDLKRNVNLTLFLWYRKQRNQKNKKRSCAKYI